jgi:hypothetical protein
MRGFKSILGIILYGPAVVSAGADSGDITTTSEIQTWVSINLCSSTTPGVAGTKQNNDMIIIAYIYSFNPFRSSHA